MGSNLPGTFEEQVMLALLHAGDNAYGMQVRREIEARVDHSVAIGAVYATLDRLEEKGWVSSWLDAGGDDGARRGRPRRYFRLEAPGIEALEEARETHAAMWRGVELEGPTEPA